MDRATDPSRTSRSTHPVQERPTASHPTMRRARGPGGSTETVVAHVMLEEDLVHRVVAVVALGPSQHMIAPS